MKARHKVTLQRVPLNNGGYDRRGNYWGTGLPLYWFSFHDHLSNLEHSDHVRAPNRYFAKLAIRAKFPSRDMRFY